MKFRGPGASLNPSAEAARAAARAAVRAPNRPQGTAPAEGVQIGPWWLTTDENGALVADHLPSGARRSLLLPPDPDNEQEG